MFDRSISQRSRERRFRQRLLGCVVAAACILAATGAASDPSRADLERDWQARGASIRESVAEHARIVAVIDGYRELREASPQDGELQWKFLRALHFAVDFSDLDDERKGEYVNEAIALSDASEDLVRRESIDAPTRARLAFWRAIARGMEAQRIGLLTLVRRGTATRMFENAQLALDLDPSVDDGGPLRLLSRLHATLPRVPFVSGWVDRTQVVPLAERAYTQDPDHPGNRLVLALAWLEFEKMREQEARELLRSIVDSKSRPEFGAEDAAIRREARERLGEG